MKTNKGLSFDQSTLSELRSILQDDFLDENEPLIVSIIHQVNSDLSELHLKLELLLNIEDASYSQIQSAKEYFGDAKKLKQVIVQHSQYVDKLEGFTRDVDIKLVSKIKMARQDTSRDFVTLKEDKQSEKFSSAS